MAALETYRIGIVQLI